MAYTTEEFIEQAKSVHGDKYDYSLSEYIKASKKVKIICPIHGVFEQSPNSHLQKHVYPKCSFEKISIKNRLGIDEFMKRANFIHKNKYEYSLVKYVNYHTKIKIICKEHGVFEKTISMCEKGKIDELSRNKKD